MCFPSTPSAPAAPPPLPVQAPPPPPAVLDVAPSASNSTSSALASNRGRSSLRIDRTQMGTGEAGTGLNIPS